MSPFMSGSKRRTCYRKTLQDDVLNGLPEPSAGQCLAVVRRSSGANLFEVCTEGGGAGVALLPTRYRKLVWLKRGDMVMLSAPSTGSLTTTDGGVGAVTHMIEAILYDVALKHLRAIGRLPPALEQVQAEIVSGGGAAEEGEEGQQHGQQQQQQQAAGGGGSHKSSAGGGGSSSGGGRRLQGPRGLPPPAEEEEEGEEEVEEGEAGSAVAAAGVEGK